MFIIANCASLFSKDKVSAVAFPFVAYFVFDHDVVCAVWIICSGKHIVLVIVATNGFYHFLVRIKDDHLVFAVFADVFNE